MHTLSRYLLCASAALAAHAYAAETPHGRQGVPHGPEAVEHWHNGGAGHLPEHGWHPHDFGHGHDGQWHRGPHRWHRGWGVGAPAWYFYPAPVYPSPDVNVPPLAVTPDTPSYWYYCADPAGYYPDVTSCNVEWQAVPAPSQ